LVRPIERPRGKGNLRIEDDDRHHRLAPRGEEASSRRRRAFLRIDSAR
jgi:hypothetical protein